MTASPRPAPIRCGCRRPTGSARSAPACWPSRRTAPWMALRRRPAGAAAFRPVDTGVPARMTTRRQALLGLAGLVVPAAAGAQPPKPTPATRHLRPKPSRPRPEASGQKGGQAAPSGPAARQQTTRQARSRGQAARRPAPGRRLPPRSGPEARAVPSTGAEAEPRPRARVRAREDGPSLRPLDREFGAQLARRQSRMGATPAGHSPSARASRCRRACPGRPCRPSWRCCCPISPATVMLAVGPDLALYATGTEVVASLLAGALAR